MWLSRRTDHGRDRSRTFPGRGVATHCPYCARAVRAMRPQAAEVEAPGVSDQPGGVCQKGDDLHAADAPSARRVTMAWTVPSCGRCGGGPSRGGGDHAGSLQRTCRCRCSCGTGAVGRYGPDRVGKAVRPGGSGAPLHPAMHPAESLGGRDAVPATMRAPSARWLSCCAARG
jgi:hypothetical protein